MKAANVTEDDIMITGVSHTAPGNPVAVSKHSAKDELSAMGKGKWNTDLSSYAHLNAQDIHSGFLNRLYTSRDYEAGLVNLMKERYEVTTQLFLLCPFSNINSSSPQVTVYDTNLNRDFVISQPCMLGLQGPGYLLKMNRYFRIIIL